MDGVGRCGGCRFWDKAPRPPSISGAENRGAHLAGDWGTCEGIDRMGDSSHTVPPPVDGPTEDLAYLSDGSGYFASLTTRADFGCRAFQPAGASSSVPRWGDSGLPGTVPLVPVQIEVTAEEAATLSRWREDGGRLDVIDLIERLAEAAP